MFYFNPISYFFKSFIRIFTKKFFWVILILLLICIGWALYDKGVFAEDSSYGNYTGFNTDIIDTANSLIEQYKGDYDSFIFRTLYDYESSKTYIYTLSFFNSADIGNIYISSLNSPNYRMYYKLNSQFSKSNSVINYTFSNNFILKQTDYSSNLSHLGLSTYNFSETNSYSLYTNRIVYTNNTYTDIFFDGGDSSIAFISPYIETESSSINNWSFDYLIINSGSEGYVYDNPITGTTSYAVVNLKYVYNGITYTQQISSGYITNWSTDNFIVEFPRTSLLNSVNIENGKSVDFYLEIKKDYVSDIIYSLGSYTFALTTEEQEQIQQDSDKALQGEILGAQQETNNKLDSLENTITDTTIPGDSEFDLPTIEVNDSTANFFDTLFTGIYNAFNTNQDTSISFTIFSKTITINSADFRMLNDSRFTILRNLLESSWYFAIGYMILKDIRHIFDKIKTGNIENAVSNDIKADMV